MEKGFEEEIKKVCLLLEASLHEHTVTCPGQVSEFMTILCYVKFQELKQNNFVFCFLVAAAVSQGLYRVWAQQAGHANRDSAGQRQSFCIHS